MHAASTIKRRLRLLKRRAGIHGFQDLQERLDEALRGPSGDRLRERLVAQFPVALVDEFQDTSPLQYRMFERLYRPADNDGATALLMIGDPKQSIYAFRDADIHSYLRARAATAGRHHVLTTNHRSVPALVEALDHLYRIAEARPDGAFRFGGGEDGPVPYVPVRAKGRDEAFVDRDGPVPALTICHDALATPRAATLERLAERCAEHVVGLLNDARAGFARRDGAFVGLRPKDVAILVADRWEARAVRRALRRRDVASAYLSDQESVFDGDEAVDLLAWLRAVAEPRDARRVRLAFATRLVDLRSDELVALADDERVFDARVEQMTLLHDVWREQGVLAMMRRALHLLDLPARWLACDGGERRLTNVLHLAELLQDASATLDGEEGVMRWLADRLATKTKRGDEEIVRLESDDDLVRVVTVHKAKGLEYPIVYLPFACTARRSPTRSPAWLPDADGERRLVFRIDDATRRRMALESEQEELRLLYVALTRARHALWLGVAAPAIGKSSGFERSAFGWLVAGDAPRPADEIAAALDERFGALPSVRLAFVDRPEAPTPRTPLARDEAPRPLHDPPPYAAAFERDWSIGSFSALVRDLAHAPPPPAFASPAAVEEILSGPVDEPDEPDEAAPSPSTAACHRFPRGPIAGNLLHDQLEWLADRRFAFGVETRAELARRCERQGWGARADDVVEWLREVAATPLPPLGIALDRLPTILSEMEFWLPSERLDATFVDRLCTTHLLDGRPRPPLPPRALHGMLMGFADLVFEHDGRYWVLDYKSNWLGPGDADYTIDALAASMAAHRYDVQGALYLVALHRLLRQRLGARYDPDRQLGGALFLFLRGVRSPTAGCHVLPADPAWLDALDDGLRAGAAADVR